MNKYKQKSVSKEVSITIDVNIITKRTSKVCLVVVNDFWVLFPGVKN